MEKSNDAFALPKTVLALGAGAVAVALFAVIAESVLSPHADAAPSAAPAAPKPTVTPEIAYVGAPQPSATTAPSAAPSTTVYMDWSAAERHVTVTGDVFEQASSLVTMGDTAGARALLEPRVFGSGHATSDEINLLRGICKSQHDRSCGAAIDAKYSP